MKRIDAHVHWEARYRLDELGAFLGQFDVRLHNVAVRSTNDAEYSWRCVEVYRELHERLPKRCAWTTSFDYPQFQEPDFVPRVLRQLDKHFSEGAVGVKVWRNLGMEIRKADGSFLMMDDPMFDPIYEFIAARNKTLLVHIGEPLVRWPSAQQRPQPLGLYRKNNRYGLLTQENPKYEGIPDYDVQIAARDRVLERFPQLRMVGAHLGSMEHDVREVAKRLDRYPNFAVDTSGRRTDLALQDREAVRDFFFQYKDRILWGMDQGAPLRKVGDGSDEKLWEWIWNCNREGYNYEFGLYESSDTVKVDDVETQGLGLPPEILQRIYYDNAMRWYPGIFT